MRFLSAPDAHDDDVHVQILCHEHVCVPVYENAYASHLYHSHVYGDGCLPLYFHDDVREDIPYHDHGFHVFYPA